MDSETPVPEAGMRRRDLLALLGGRLARSGLLLALLVAPITGGRAADAPKRIGFLASSTCSVGADNPAGAALIGRLAELSWVEGRTLIRDCVLTYGRFEQAPALAAELVARRPDVLFGASTPTVRALMQATATIPIISTASDPIESGLVKNLARPEGNVTGISQISFDLVAKRVELLKQLVPRLSRLAFVARIGGDLVDLERQSSELNHAADVLGFSWQVFSLAGAEDADKVFANLAAEGFDAAYIAPGPVTYQLREQIGDAARQYRVPTVADQDVYARAGALLSYGVDVNTLFARGAEYIDKILRGAKPADLPVEQPTKFRLIINVKTAKALGLDVPPQLQQLADEVIE
jgi:putative tryptophan/tyrosine transport system substrate-binding protein